MVIVDLSHFRIRKRIPLDTAPSLVLAHPTEHRALVLSRDGGAVYDIDAVKLEVARRGRAGNTAVAMRFSESGDAGLGAV